jgi:formate dehydrogenase gamma subunit
VGVIGFMLLHNGLLFLKKVVRIYRTQHRSMVRMDLGQRWQHVVLLASFIALAVTGFALKFPDSWVALLLGSNETFRRWSHRVAGVVMLGLAAYHLFYVLFTKPGRRLVKDLLPAKKDVADLSGSAKYLAGLSPEKPPMGRFGYPEKMEYWAVVWGTVIMGGTGVMIWFKMAVTHFLPRWAVDVATTVHYYEAILACLAIAVWHFYYVMFDPDVYPFNFAVWDGKVSKEWMNDEHPLDEALQSRESAPEQTAPGSAGPQPDAPGGKRDHGADPQPRA